MKVLIVPAASTAVIGAVCFGIESTSTFPNWQTAGAWALLLTGVSLAAQLLHWFVDKTT